MANPNCSRCGGSGYYEKTITVKKNVPCSNCNGTGFKAEYNEEEGWHDVACSSCGGLGDVTEISTETISHKCNCR